MNGIVMKITIIKLENTNEQKIIRILMMMMKKTIMIKNN